MQSLTKLVDTYVLKQQKNVATLASFTNEEQSERRNLIQRVGWLAAVSPKTVV
jgi:hypothetical protein